MCLFAFGKLFCDFKAIACGVQCNWRMKCSESNKPTKKKGFSSLDLKEPG